MTESENGAEVNPTSEPVFDENYFYALVEDRNLVIQQYDKLVITLSGGAIGIVLSFSDKASLGHFYHPCLFWASSLIIILIAFMLGMIFHISNVKRYKETNESLDPNGWLSFMPIYLTFISGGLFVIGVAVMLFSFPSN